MHHSMAQYRIQVVILEEMNQVYRTTPPLSTPGDIVSKDAKTM